jgi:hypothetical protein
MTYGSVDQLPVTLACAEAREVARTMTATVNSEQKTVLETRWRMSNLSILEVEAVGESPKRQN